MHEAKSPSFPGSSNWSRKGETVIIARHGEPVAELVPARRKAGFPFGIAREEPLVPAGDEWWQP